MSDLVGLGGWNVDLRLSLFVPVDGDHRVAEETIGRKPWEACDEVSVPTVRAAFAAVQMGGAARRVHFWARGKLFDATLQRVDIHTTDVAIRYVSRYREVSPVVLSLSPRQLQLARLIALGVPTTAAADKLGISTSTARTYVERLLAATGCRRQSELPAWVCRNIGL